jgi:hypothetical protein
VALRAATFLPPRKALGRFSALYSEEEEEQEERVSLGRFVVLPTDRDEEEDL